MIAGITGAAAAADLTYDDLVSGLAMRDSIIRDVTLEYNTLSTFPDGRTGILPKKFRYIYKDDCAHMRVERSGGDLSADVEIYLKDRVNVVLQPATRTASRTLGPGWQERLDYLYQFDTGADTMRKLGAWFEEHPGEIVGKTIIDGHQSYGISDGTPQEGDGVSHYVVWVVPEAGFAPARIDRYENGYLFKVVECRKLSKNGDLNLFDPQEITVWHLNLDDRLRSFDTSHPVGSWVRVDSFLNNVTYNQGYSDDFFSVTIPDGYTVTDELLGSTYVSGDLVSNKALDRLINDTKMVFRRPDEVAAQPVLSSDSGGPVAVDNKIGGHNWVGLATCVSLSISALLLVVLARIRHRRPR